MTRPCETVHCHGCLRLDAVRFRSMRVLAAVAAVAAAPAHRDAAIRGDAEHPQFFIRGRADVNAAQANGTTTLRRAIYHENAELTEVLRRGRARERRHPRRRDAAGHGGAVPAARLVDRLLKAGADAASTQQRTLHHPRRVQCAVTKSSSCSSKPARRKREGTDCAGRRRLMWAVARNANRRSCAALLCRGGEPPGQVRAGRRAATCIWPPREHRAVEEAQQQRRHRG